MNIRIGTASVLAGLLAASFPATAQTTTAPAAVVHITGFAFSPKIMTIAVGQTVTFVNDDTEPHTATAVDKSFDSEGLDLHGSWKHPFPKPGTYAYFCEMHPYMKGTIVVDASKAAN